MRLFLRLSAFTILLGCNSIRKGDASIYLANNDSIYYCENTNFNPQNLQSGTINDSTFINQMLLQISKKKADVLLKPMTSFSANGEPVGETIAAFCNKINRYGINYRIAKTDSSEKKYFGATSMQEFLENK